MKSDKAIRNEIEKLNTKKSDIHLALVHLRYTSCEISMKLLRKEVDRLTKMTNSRYYELAEREEKRFENSSH